MSRNTSASFHSNASFSGQPDAVQPACRTLDVAVPFSPCKRHGQHQPHALERRSTVLGRLRVQEIRDVLALNAVDAVILPSRQDWSA
jgi:hypothetical protein